MISKYQKIYEDLKHKIDTNEIPAHTYLPSENELMQIYQASRDTIRKSLALLLQRGYIQKSKGKGSLVLDHDKIAFPVSTLTSFKELASHMKNVETKVVCFKEEVPNENLKQELQIETGDIYHIERVRKIDGEKIILDTDDINATLIPNLTKDIAQDSIYDYIENTLGLKIAFARKEMTVIKATEKEKALLDLQDYDFLVCVKSYVYLEDATLFQYTKSMHRPDKFRFVEFARRNEI